MADEHESDQRHGEAAGVQEDPPSAAGHTMRDLSREMVRLYKEQFGRGPETVRSTFASPDVIISVLGNTFSPVELAMRAMGEHQRLRDIRTMFQHATEPKFREAVEAVTGRKVIGFMSGTDVEHDLCCEVFTLEPLTS
jgi:uncharacterized protein YbcI